MNEQLFYQPQIDEVLNTIQTDPCLASTITLFAHAMAMRRFLVSLGLVIDEEHTEQKVITKIAGSVSNKMLQTLSPIVGQLLCNWDIFTTTGGYQKVVNTEDILNQVSSDFIYFNKITESTYNTSEKEDLKNHLLAFVLGFAPILLEIHFHALDRAVLAFFSYIQYTPSNILGFNNHSILFMPNKGMWKMEDMLSSKYDIEQIIRISQYAYQRHECFKLKKYSTIYDGLLPSIDQIKKLIIHIDEHDSLRLHKEIPGAEDFVNRIIQLPEPTEN